MSRIFANNDHLKGEDEKRLVVLRRLVSFLHKHLAENWEIYVHPFLNGDYPDVVLLNSRVGVQFIELVTGARDEYEVIEETHFSEGQKKQIRRKQCLFHGSPILRLGTLVDHYREKLISEYLPQIGESIARNEKNYSAFRIGLFFPEMTREEAVTLVDMRYCTIAGSDTLSKHHVQVLVPDAKLSSSYSMDEAWADEIRSWLAPVTQLEDFEPYDLNLLASQDQRIYPNWKDISKFKTPLTLGERHLVQILSEHLDSDWEIYVEPFVNGDRPDVIAFHPQKGLWIFEVKDWQVQNYHQRNGILYVTDKRGTWPIKDEKNPARQIRRYRETWTALLRSSLIFESVNSAATHSPVIYSVLYCHRIKGEAARALFTASDTWVCGSDNLADLITKMLTNNATEIFSPLQAAFIRAWLRPPWHFLDQLEPITLTREQMRFTEPTPRRRQRVRGVAGSGKSLVLAQRAANLAANGKRVLVVSFNITLWHYLRDQVSRTNTPFEKAHIEFNHFHGFCRDYLKENGVRWPQDETDEDTLFQHIVPELVIATKQANKNRKRRSYDAILIDEGQDFTDKWFKVLSEFLTENSEVLLVADSRQNVYHRGLRWIDQPMAGFSGRWGELKQSYRLPGLIRREAERFARQFNLPTDIEFEPIQLGLEDPHLRWCNVESLKEATEKVESTFLDLVIEAGVHPSDIAILVPNRAEGTYLVEHFVRKGIEVNHIFAVPGKKHSHKVTFEMGVGKLKICTIHSFKGWEIANILVLTPATLDALEHETWTDELFYTAITRTKHNLFVFNRFDLYQRYGAEWERMFNGIG